MKKVNKKRDPNTSFEIVEEKPYQEKRKRRDRQRAFKQLAYLFLPIGIMAFLHLIKYAEYSPADYISNVLMIVMVDISVIMADINREKDMLDEWEPLILVGLVLLYISVLKIPPNLGLVARIIYDGLLLIAIISWGFIKSKELRKMEERYEDLEE